MQGSRINILPSFCRLEKERKALFIRIEKKTDLKKAQVFVASPFLYGGYVYAIGNEYYMKNRNIHRFSLSKNDWEFIF